MNNPSYSLIIPHYNSPALLVRCLKTIPEIQDIQVVVVDDNSPEAESYLSRYPELSRSNVLWVRTTEGRGAGYARNKGLEYAVGKWVIFADADDFFTLCFQDILDDYRQSEADLIFFNACSLRSDNLQNSDRADWLSIPIGWALTEWNKAEFWLRYQFGAPWCRIIRRSLLEEHQIRFDEVPIHNDTRFGYLVGYHATSILVDQRAGYCLTDCPNSITTTKQDEKKILATIKVGAQRQRFLDEHNIAVWDHLVYEAMNKVKSSRNDQLKAMAEELLVKELPDSEMRRKVLKRPRNLNVFNQGWWRPFLFSYFGQSVKAAYLENGWHYKILSFVNRLILFAKRIFKSNSQ